MTDAAVIAAKSVGVHQARGDGKEVGDHEETCDLQWSSTHFFTAIGLPKPEPSRDVCRRPSRDDSPPNRTPEVHRGHARNSDIADHAGGQDFRF